MSDDLDTGISLNINVSRRGTQFGGKARITGNRVYILNLILKFIYKI